jgi:hypothetical protein
LLEASTDLAAREVFTLVARERRVVHLERHRDRRLVHLQRPQAFALPACAHGIGDLQILDAGSSACSPSISSAAGGAVGGSK